MIDLINKQTGEEHNFDLGHLKATRGFCPGCHHKRTDKRNRSFRWNAQKGYGFCYYCNVVFYDKDRKAYNPSFHSSAGDRKPVLASSEPVATTRVVEMEFII